MAQPVHIQTDFNPMCRIYFVLLLFPLILLTSSSKLRACGYDFIGSCSTDMVLSINNTQDVFAIAPCPFETGFPGLQFGVIQSLVLKGGHAITWESCQNNVTDVTLYFRVYEQGASASAWQTLTLAEDLNTLEGPYTTRYRSITTNQNLTSGLIPGKKYILEAYYRAEIDTIGDDFIPETFMLQDNKGLFYQATFEYGGASAPPFTVVVTRDEDVHCKGDSTGLAGVSVYGNQSGLFYQWSAYNQNFFRIDSLPAGTYSVTVSGVNGYTQTASILISQPQLPLSADFGNIVPVSCNGSPGQATVSASGGKAPYAYQWANGQQTAAATFVSSGLQTVSVSDANACTKVFAVDIPGNTITQLTENVALCAGEAYQRGGKSFDATGTYLVTASGNNGCDTLINLIINVLSPATAISIIPGAEQLTCAQPSLILCPLQLPGINFIWKKEGAIFSSDPCATLNTGGNYSITAIQSSGAKVCQSAKGIFVETHLQAGNTSANGTFHDLTPCNPSDSVQLILEAGSSLPVASYAWHYAGGVVSAADSFSIMVSLTGFAAPVVVITDVYGCVSKPVVVLNSINNPGAPQVQFSDQKNLCNGLIHCELSAFGGMPPYEIAWSNPALQGFDIETKPGLYSGMVKDANGCGTFFGLELKSVQLLATVIQASGANAADGAAVIGVSGDNWPVSILWNNGATSAGIYNLKPGDYCVTVVDNDGCRMDTCLTVSFTNGIPVVVQAQWAVFPNPVQAGHPLHLNLPEIFDNQYIDIELRALNGQFCFAQTLAGAPSLNVQTPANIPSGAYSLQIRGAGYIFKKMLLVR